MTAEGHVRGRGADDICVAWLHADKVARQFVLEHIRETACGLGFRAQGLGFRF